MKHRMITLVLAITVLMTSTCGVFAASSPTYQTRRTGKTYTTTVYALNGRAYGTIKTTRYAKVCVVESSKLTTWRLTHRKNNYIIVEKITGTCLNARGDGKTSSGHYISYAKVKGHAKGKRYTTWLVYGNDNSIDNVAMRFDR